MGTASVHVCSTGGNSGGSGGHMRNPRQDTEGGGVRRCAGDPRPGASGRGGSGRRRARHDSARLALRRRRRSSCFTADGRIETDFGTGRASAPGRTPPSMQVTITPKRQLPSAPWTSVAGTTTPAGLTLPAYRSSKGSAADCVCPYANVWAFRPARVTILSQNGYVHISLAVRS